MRPSQTDALWNEMYDSATTEFLELPRARVILDVGCGSGMWAATLHRLRKRANLVALDSSAPALAQASESIGGEVELIRADASRLPFKDNTFDLVTCRRLLINLRPRRRRAALREMIRVSRGGRIVSPVEPSLQTNRANHFSTIRGNIRFSKSLEKAVSGTDFTLGPRMAYLLVREGLEEVDVWAYPIVNSYLPPKYGDLFLSTVVHGGGFVHALSTVSPPLKGSTGKRLQKEAARLDREVRRQRDRKSLVSVTELPMFITKGRKPVSN